MESIYYVLCWACHRKCKHCYEPRFRPYVRSALDTVVAEARENFPRIIGNLPESLRYLDLTAAREDRPEGYEQKPGRIILAGGEVLIDPVREQVLYPALALIAARYAGQGVQVVVQTTGDLVTPAIIDDLLARGVWMISVSGMDDYHVGMTGARRQALRQRLATMFEAAGVTDASRRADQQPGSTTGPVFSMFGATEDAWIGKLWPRGRAWQNSLSTATITDNFCNAWSGGLNFLQHRYSGSEVSIDPNGDVYPCCLKTQAPLGNLTEERLEDILDSLVGHPALEAISMGHPERMGLSYGWDVTTFLEQSRTTQPDDRPYRNLCIGCDRFHEQVLAPMLTELRRTRMASRGDGH